MKKLTIFLFSLSVLCVQLYAQEAEKKTVSTYYRNALTSMMIFFRVSSLENR